MKFPMRFLILLFIFLNCWAMQAQQPDSISVELAPPPEITSPGPPPPHPSFIKRYFNDNYPIPRRAAFLSFILPGAGQAYNKKWWKMPIVYGALGTAIYFEIDNIKQYRALRDNYKWLVDEDPNTNPTEEPYIFMDATTLKGYRDQWRRYVELSSLALGFVYLLQVTDAYVDAHLHSFDVSDDLSLRFKPKIGITSGLGATFGAGVSLEFGNSRRQQIPQNQTLFSNP